MMFVAVIVSMVVIMIVIVRMSVMRMAVMIMFIVDMLHTRRHRYGGGWLRVKPPAK